jgi:dethiobiotin synthetase
VRGVFVTGTDTGVGKTYVAGALAVGWREDGLRVGLAKPVITGLDGPGPHDHELLGAVTAARFGPPVSPHLAAELAGTAIDPATLIAAVTAAADGVDVVIAEGAGGLLAPIADGYDMGDLACELGLPLVIAARPGLGTINHTLLTLEAARTRGLEVASVVLTPWPAEPSAMELSNRDTIALHAPVTTLAQDEPALRLGVRVPA